MSTDFNSAKMLHELVLDFSTVSGLGEDAIRRRQNLMALSLRLPGPVVSLRQRIKYDVSVFCLGYMPTPGAVPARDQDANQAAVPATLVKAARSL